MRSLIVAVALTIAAPAAARSPSIPVADAPELAALGPSAVGLEHVTVTTPAGRSLDVMVWYPATPAPGAKPQTYARTLTPDDFPPLAVTTEGIAVPGAPAKPGRLPLVIISHGFGGWAGGMTYLAENIASKNYIVAAIDHADGQGGVNGGGAAGRLKRVAGTIINRARDQEAVLSALAARAADPKDAIGRRIDASNIAIIGYSMGGFGVLATAGAAYDKNAPTVAPLGGRLDDQTVRVVDPRLKAIVAIAPWGGQPAFRSWTADSVAAIKVPSLFIAGDHDDVAQYPDGIRWLYDHATGSNRWLLVYREAHHNTGGNPPMPETRDRPDMAESFAEPVWRAERINAINQHFVTAFLDRFLKGDAKHGAYLDVPTVDGDAATWADAPRGYAGAAQATYWPGFQRRWLLGLELHHDAAQ
ncbi:alpha/beta hydrolase family protein [Glacieibacterium megasporae]|uniref:alpha/beta hydrolase family protein n=1 Tax=Glacieibacterium megasporae TaxID=2835787 RepID=UPI001C1DFACC|nr:dienelactone hydrolase [Polymorphobacter megasporae]UAJ10154.1 dienelactone hydrolase [Polymorphobacter megasporae]